MFLIIQFVVGYDEKVKEHTHLFGVRKEYYTWMAHNFPDAVGLPDHDFNTDEEITEHGKKSPPYM